MSSFKKVLLDYLNLSKKASIALFKKINENNVEKWVQFNKHDLD